MLEQRESRNDLVRYPAIASIAVCLIAAAGCSPDLRSTEFACTDLSDCVAMGRVCQQGWCVLPGGVTPDGGSTGRDAQTCAPPTVDGQESSTLAAGESLTWSHVVGEGDDRLLVVGISFSSMAVGAAIASVQTDDGELTLLQNNGVASIVRSEIWALSDPPSGTQTIQVEFTGSVAAVGGSISLFGVDQTSPTDTALGASGTAGDPAVTVPSSPGELVVGCVSAVSNGAGGLNVGSGQTELWNNVAGGVLPVRGAGGVAPGAASVTLDWSVTGNTAWAISAVNVQACP